MGWLGAAVLVWGAGLAGGQEPPAGGDAAPATLPPIAWAASVDAALAEIAVDPRPLAVYYSTAACPVAPLFENETLESPQVRVKAAAFRWARISAETERARWVEWRLGWGPGIVVVGPAGEHIHRFDGYRTPDECVAELDEAARRFGLFRDGGRWDAYPPAPERLTDAAEVVAVPVARTASVFGGITVLGGRCFVSSSRIQQFDPTTGVVAGPEWTCSPTTDLASDGKRLYALFTAFSGALGLHVLDPATGKIERTVTAPLDKAGPMRLRWSGIEWAGDQLWVLERGPGRLLRISPTTGETKETRETGLRDLYGLGFDGKHLGTGTHDALVVLDPATGRVVRRIPMHYPVQEVTWHAGAWFCVSPGASNCSRLHDLSGRGPQHWSLLHRVTPSAGG